jgi:hypothetical protein
MKTQMQFNIPEPCHESESKMITCGEGKFCFSCRKYVYDFTNWTKEELQDFFKNKSSESICGKVRPEILTKPTPVSRRVLRMFAYAFYLVFGMMLFSCNQTTNNSAGTEQSNQSYRTTGMVISVPPLTPLPDTITLPELKIRPHKNTMRGDLVQHSNFRDTLKLDTVKLDATIQGVSWSSIGLIQCTCPNKNNIRESENRLDTISQVTNEQQVYENQSLKVFPNPSTGNFNIAYKSREEGDVLVKVYDMSGREVAVLEDSKQKPAGEYTLNAQLSFASSGMYIVFASLGKEVFTEEVAVQK